MMGKRKVEAMVDIGVVWETGTCKGEVEEVHDSLQGAKCN